MTEPSPAEQDRELQKCSRSPGYFIDRYCVIESGGDDSGGAEMDDDGSGAVTQPFRLWPAQRGVVKTLADERLVAILKARQLGISWAVLGYVFHQSEFKRGKVSLLFSMGQDEANEMLRRVKVMYRGLPGWMKRRLPRPRSLENKAKLEFTNGSRITSLPATEHAGRSRTAAIVVIDEAAIMVYARRLYAAAKPTIDAGGQLIILSTANGVGGMFHSVYTKAVAGINGFKAVFLPWWARPDRDADFRDRMTRESDDPGSIPQEYPENAIEAFLASGRMRFQADWISRQAKYVEQFPPLGKSSTWPVALFRSVGWDGIDRSLIPNIADVPGVTFYKSPEPNRKYLIAADVAEGLEDGDYDSAVVLDRDTREEVADLHGLWEPDEYARYLMALSEPYQADVIVERNNHGHAVLATFRTAKFPRVAMGHDKKPGWLTNEVTKPQGVDLLASNLRDDTVSVRTAQTLAEMQVYARLGGGRLGARHGFHDDRVMMWVVALSYLRLADFAQRGGRSVRAASPVSGYRG